MHLLKIGAATFVKNSTLPSMSALMGLIPDSPWTSVNCLTCMKKASLFKWQNASK